MPIGSTQLVGFLESGSQDSRNALKKYYTQRMEPRQIPIALFCLAMMILLFRRGTIDAIGECIESFTNNFRGGPPTHPLPGDDGQLIRRRAKRAETRADI